MLEKDTVLKYEKDQKEYKMLLPENCTLLDVYEALVMMRQHIFKKMQELEENLREHDKQVESNADEKEECCKEEECKSEKQKAEEDK